MVDEETLGWMLENKKLLLVVMYALMPVHKIMRWYECKKHI